MPFAPLHLNAADRIEVGGDGGESRVVGIFTRLLKAVCVCKMFTSFPLQSAAACNSRALRLLAFAYASARVRTHK